jgi:RNA polymerase primary sigma factor
MVQAISACRPRSRDPGAADKIAPAPCASTRSSTADRSEAEEELPQPASAAAAAAEDFDDDDDGEDGASAANSAKLEALKAEAVEKFDHIVKWFDKMRIAYEREGYKSKGYLKAQTEIQDELMTIRFTAKMVEKLADTLRSQVEEVRSLERAIMHICVHKVGMPREHFIRSFPATRPTCAGSRRRPSRTRTTSRHCAGTSRRCRTCSRS